MKKKNAFTMLELILVIIVMGIIAANAIPRLKRDTRIEAINHMLTMIRYTQNLALHDSKHSIDNPNWQRSFWKFRIYHCDNNTTTFYTIGTDSNLDGQMVGPETVIDPSNGKHMYWSAGTACPKGNSYEIGMGNNRVKVSKNIFITQEYGIKDVKFNACGIMQDITSKTKTNKAKYIGFDNFGRPIKGNEAVTNPTYYGHTRSDCKITFFFEDNSIKPFKIIIPPESGYAYLEENPNL